MDDIGQRAAKWGWACASCGIAFQGELGDPCPDCGAFGKRTVWEDEVLVECLDCGAAYIDRSHCPRCLVRRRDLTAKVMIARFDLEWDRLFDTLPGFMGWSEARELAKAIAQEQRIAVMSLSSREPV